MQAIRNKNELDDFVTILEEFEGVAGEQYSSAELMDAAGTFLSVAKGSISKQKISEHGWSDDRYIVDAYTMMSRQPSGLTMDCLDDFGCIEDCMYSKFADRHFIKQFLEG